MKYLQQIGLLIFSVLLFSCNNEKAEREALQDQVIAVHDEVMPKMGELRKVMKQLEARADSVLSSDEQNRELANTLLNGASDISNANEAMMMWMRAFDPTLIQTEPEHQKVMDYLKDQKQKIDKVKEDMMGTLSAGKELMK